MIGIRFRFLAGRYHATAWDHQVNEGTVEWPPSPWRVIRALTSAHWWLPEERRPHAQRAILALCEVLPRYALPPISLGHTRHYMPTNTKPTKVFDTFALVGGGAGSPGAELVVGWPGVDLDEDAQRAFCAMLPHVGYLGRAEAWVLAEQSHPTAAELSLAPQEGIPSDEVVELMAPPTRAGFAAWRESFLDQALDKKDLSRRKKNAPRDLWELLHVDTGELYTQQWSGPPGVRAAVYPRPVAGALPSVIRSPTTAHSRPVVARFALRSAVLPPLEHTLSVGERLRVALMSRARDEDGHTLPIFSGRDAQGRPLQSGRHAFFLPLDDDEDGRLDHLLVWSRRGFEPGAQEALHSLTRLWGAEGHDLHLVLVGVGAVADHGTTLVVDAPGRTPAIGPARVWESRTPFVPFRHPKRRNGRWKDAPEDQVRLACSHLDLPAPVTVEPLDQLPPLKRRSKPLEWHRYYRERKSGGGSLGSRRGYGFRLVFSEPITGPLALGYAAHFGLGRFVAVQ